MSSEDALVESWQICVFTSDILVGTCWFGSDLPLKTGMMIQILRSYEESREDQKSKGSMSHASRVVLPS